MVNRSIFFKVVHWPSYCPYVPDIQKNKCALEILLKCHIEQMSDVPINGYKKVLENSAEVLSVNKNKVKNEQVIKRFKAWKATQALEKIIQKLLSAES